MAEPDDERRARFAQAHRIPPQRQYKSWQEALAAAPLARAVINCTQDKLHFDSTMAALQAGARASLESHLMAFAAEESRHTRRAMDMGAYRA